MYNPSLKGIGINQIRMIQEALPIRSAYGCARYADPNSFRKSP